MDSDCYTVCVTTSEWSIYAVNEVRDWIFALDPVAKERVVQAIDDAVFVVVRGRKHSPWPVQFPIQSRPRRHRRALRSAVRARSGGAVRDVDLLPCFVWRSSLRSTRRRGSIVRSRRELFLESLVKSFHAVQ